jgi:hypothetical protein
MIGHTAVKKRLMDDKKRVLLTIYQIPRLFVVVRGKSGCAKQDIIETHYSSHSRYSVHPALSLKEGILHCNILEGTFNTTSFYKFIECTLNHMQPFPALNSVIVMDNCRIHKHPDIQDLIESQ